MNCKTVLLSAAVLTTMPAHAATACANLKNVSSPHATITMAETVAAGAFQPQPGGRGGPQQFADLPEFCRVQAELAPSSDSAIKVELWMPAASRWNGKFRGVGNGGLGGGSAVNPGGLANAVRDGYATAGNNTGHEGGSDYAIGHPEKIKDFGYRSSHEMTVFAKALIAAYYDSPLKYSLMAESGGGTIAALSAAQRFPQDYDVLAVVSMSSYLSHHTFGQMWTWYATHESQASFIPTSKYAVLHQTALKACDADDGLADGIIGAVERCRFDPAVIQCRGADAPDCLTAPQVEAARKIYAGPKNPRTGEQVYSPIHPGSELGWEQLAGGAEPLDIPVDFFRYYVFQDPRWDYKTRRLNFDSDVKQADRAEVAPVNAVDPDLRKYFTRGGKLLLIGGWNDAAVPPDVAVNYYKAVVAKTGAAPTRESMRFFMVPGMAHGLGTRGAENFNADTLALIEQWKQGGQAPNQLIVSHYKDGKEVGRRLVCQYPQIAFYKGSGNTEDPASFECK
ncbi:MAG TPA: tannase/feruloyl esterase family alpha/beta hydrolase [Bryobacteraceae bacterium]|nr:tannase/feruloyl esterase family alpha/beta hydrolase [Bryobacteraceae bacterium]